MAPKHAKGTKSEPGTSENEEASIKSGPPMPWTGEVHTTNTVAGRCYHTSVLFDGKLILIGGWSGNGAQHAQEVHAYDFGTNTWATVEALGEPHPGTSQASAADVGNAMLFFGGWNGTTRVAKATLLQLESMQWSDFPNTGDKVPPPTTFHTCSAVGKRFYVFGGNTADGSSSDMFILDLTSTQWQLAQPLGAPGKRSSHTASVVDSSIVIIGGRGGADGTQPLSDVAVFDTTNNHWVIGVKVEGALPPRYGHSAVTVGSKVVVFGGVGDQGQLLNDVWVLEVERPNHVRWVRIASEGPAPTPRTGHSAVETMTGMYVAGGRTDAVAHTCCSLFLMDLAPIAPAPPTSPMDEVVVPQGEPSMTGTSIVTGGNVQTPNPSSPPPA